ncbi:hypothetical protein CYLTODRAFT_418209 [Cylindrobasidium torrendii FP15055 ss-10]|uniref:CTLH domain-containing protein n=1 Tax=Cylindrobasidium torrendii FP15055 ss-10 TaxID=1314674 RepID=A0A0D7BP83_9AGAR|nr:hypothetical protein CYLTODRAFT_418209 [Cylindrobasidium torrendii FP15055 ss-10]
MLRKTGPRVPDPTPHQLRSLVLDYLVHHSYTNTARALVRDTTVRHFNADGEETSLVAGQPNATRLDDSALLSAERRLEIRHALLAGNINRARELISKYFPTVLNADDTTPKGSACNISESEYFAPKSVEPSHLDLNLHIQAFIEACRTRPLPYPLRTPSSTTAATPTVSRRESAEIQKTIPDPHDLDQQTALLKKAQKLYMLANLLIDENKARYLKELSLVLGILAYKVPEDSSLAKYLSQERREAVADQIEAAIFYRTGERLISNIELQTRYTSTLWSVAREFPSTPLSGAVLPPRNGPITPKSGSKEPLPLFDLKHFLGAT